MGVVEADGIPTFATFLITPRRAAMPFHLLPHFLIEIFNCDYAALLSGIIITGCRKIIFKLVN